MQKSTIKHTIALLICLIQSMSLVKQIHSIYHEMSMLLPSLSVRIKKTPYQMSKNKLFT